MNKSRWGILSTAKIGTQKVIPAIQKAYNCEVTAIASRDADKAQEHASTLGIEKAYGTYEALLDDPDIDIIYNPLPNHLHVAYTIKALEAGKHVLCEKPIGLNTAEAEELLERAADFPKLKVMEAFMYRFHPHWIKTIELIKEGAVGEVKAIQSFFSYNNPDPKNIRNQADIGGGALMDIGCYCISFPRFILGAEPLRAVGLIDRDPEMKIDRITSAMLDFGEGRVSTFTCSTQLMPYQRIQIVGINGRIEIEIPVNAPPDRSVKIYLNTPQRSERMSFEAVDQYALQAEAFAAAVLNDTPVPTPLSDALNNMKVIDAIFKSAEHKQWENM
ncbi:Gfo/Idh/MocA family protein [Roseimarinus sediminis]|uniref:Gfo/Idh/MocA family protein n=1 Tax=Roseimarinus sediminis TaxID=1610899 RepID=UPI003D203FEC